MSSAPAHAQQVVVTLPDNGLFTAWVTSEKGGISTVPFNVRGHETIAVRIRTVDGQTLYVLDGATGRMAASRLRINPDGSASPVALLVSDFQLIGQPGAAAAALPSSRPNNNVLLGHAETVSTVDPDAEDAAPAAVKEGDEWTTPLATFLIGATLAGICAWIIQKLMRRSQPEFQYASSSAPMWEPAGPEPGDRDIAARSNGRQRYRVTKSAARRSRHRSRIHVPQLVGTDGLAAGARFVLSTPTVSIGRDGDNEIVLAETKVSRHHARIEHEQSGNIMLIDEASANGVFVNGMRVEKAVLHQGDEIKIGDSFFRYEE
ncbi:FHA domain-containing protein [Capsulimonas corticalis]|uniref:FHA domain-containing protein n=1 Tax=Capsulimonas corticalis TaxID=2219043 RepID=UPI001401EA10|nr:FHA domain-containing protein [Capsulimonas corticalis]